MTGLSVRVFASLVVLLCICTMSGCVRFHREYFENVLTTSSGTLDLSKKYRVQKVDSNVCVTMPKDGAPTLKPCDIAYTDQNVTLESDGANYVVRSVTADQCLYDNVGGQFGKEDCSVAAQPDQHWVMANQAVGRHGPIVNSVTSRCMTSKDDQLTSTGCDDSKSQHWKLVQQNL